MSIVVMGVAVLGAIVLVSAAVGIYNGLVLVKNNIDKSWANIDVLLKQRHDEIPKLVKVCEGYMAHERGVFDRVMKAREALLGASAQPDRLGAAEGELRGALRQLFALAENYPDLKAQAGFQQLQARISSLESEIADRREFYNDSVNTYNVRIESIPDVFVARFMNLPARQMFQVAETDKQDVEINFQTPPAG